METHTKMKQGQWHSSTHLEVLQLRLPVCPWHPLVPSLRPERPSAGVQGENLQVRICVLAFKWMLGFPAAFYSTRWTKSPWIFIARHYVGFSSQHFSSCHRGYHSIQILSSDKWAQGQSLCPHPSCQSQMGFFFISLVVGLLFS